MTLRRPGALTQEALLAAGAAASLTAILLWAGPPGNDLAAHLYQRTLFLKHGFVLWNNFWYAGRYSFVTYSVLYYPLSALVGIKVLGLVSITAAALAFAVVVGLEWGRAARWSSRTFAVAWACTALSAAFPFALGAALALVAIWALQEGRRWRFAVLVLFTLAASPLACLFLGLVLLGVGITRTRPRKELAIPVAALGAAAALELGLRRLFPDAGRFPFHTNQLIPALIFCALGALMTSASSRARPLLGLFVVYLVACVVFFAVPTELGANVERLRYAAIPLALLAVSVAAWRPLAVALPLLAIAAIWNVQPLIANYRKAAADTGSKKTYWQPAVRYLHAHLTPSYRVEVVDTVEHWPAVYLPEARVPIVRGLYRQNDFPANAVLYDDDLGPATYRKWLRSQGVRYVVLSDALPDYSSRAEKAVLTSGHSGLRIVFRSTHLAIYELSRPTPVITGPAPAKVVSLSETRLVFHVTAAGRYQLAVRFSPYWHTFQACVSKAPDGTTRLVAFKPGRIVLAFRVSAHRSLEALAGLEPARFCHS